MTGKHSVTIAAFVGLILFVALGGAAFGQAPTLNNPGFEQGFYLQDGVGELEVANGWTAWYVEGQNSPGGQRYHRPEFKPEPSWGRVLAGDYAQKMFTTYAPHNGGLRQEVQVTPGSWYRFCANVYVWSSSEDNPDQSVRAGRYRAMVGANPWGDWNAMADTTIWGQEIVDVYNRWATVCVTFEAWSDRVALFTRGNPWYGSKHNDSYWDQLSLRELASPGTGPTATPPPTYTPYPTYTPQPTPPPCPTCVPGAGSGCPDEETIYGLVRIAVRDELELLRFGVIGGN